jgi:hypothetical protein
MNRCAAAQNRGAQWNGARLVQVVGLLGFPALLGCHGLFRFGRWGFTHRSGWSGTCEIRHRLSWSRLRGRLLHQARALRGFFQRFRLLAVSLCFRFGLENRRGGTVSSGGQWGMRLAAVIASQLIGFVFVDRARMGDLFGDAKFVQLVDDLARLDFQLPRQFIDSNLTHIEAVSFKCL